MLDDLAPLRDLAGNSDLGHFGNTKAYLYAPAPSYRLWNAGTPVRTPPGLGTNPPTGVVLDYYLKEAPTEDQAKKVKLEILTADGKVIRTFQGKPPEEKGAEKAKPQGDAKEAKKDVQQAASQKPSEEAPPAGPKGEEMGKDKGKEAEKQEKEEADEEEDQDQPKIPTEAGHNRFTWDMTWPGALKVPGMILWSGQPGDVLAVPGRYQARLTAAGETLTQPFEIRKDPRSTSTQEDLEAQYRFQMEIRDKLTETHDAIRRIRDIRAQLDDMKKHLRKDESQKAVVDAAKELDKKMTEVEEALYQTKNRSPQDPLNFPVRLNDKLNGVASSASLGDYRPSAQAVAVKNDLTAAIDAQLAKLRQIWETDLARFNDLAKEKSVPAVILPPARLK